MVFYRGQLLNYSLSSRTLINIFNYILHLFLCIAKQEATQLLIILMHGCHTDQRNTQSLTHPPSRPYVIICLQRLNQPVKVPQFCRLVHRARSQEAATSVV